MGANEDGIRWMRKTFGKQIDDAVKGTPFTSDLVIAIALQETGFIWKPQSKTAKTPEEVLALCVGDTLDTPKRSAFPKNRAALEAEPKGKDMFKVAREALVNLGTINDTYKKIAKAKPDKFCHGFGMFQYDLQFFKVDAEYFLKRKWATAEGTIGHCVKELKDKLVTVYGKGKTSLTHKESVYVAIAYNKGSADTKKSFKQGFKDSSGVFYGEHIDEYLTLCEKTK